MVSRAGAGIALQAKPDYAAQPIQQIRREAKSNKDRLGDIRVRQQKALKAANEDISAVDKEVHPVYNPAVENIKENFYKNVGELKKRKPLNWANTTEFTKEKNKLLQGLNYLKQSTENIQSEREQAQKDPDRVLDPDFQQALKNQDLQKVQELTGNKYGYYGGGRMRTIRDAGQAFSDAAEQAGGLTKVGTSIKPAEYGQLQKTSVKELPEEEFKNQLAATYDQYESDWKEMGFENREDFIKQGYESVRKQAIDQDYKNMPDQDGRGGGRGGEGQTIFGGIQRDWEQINEDVYDQVSTGRADAKDVQNIFSQQTGLRPADVQGTDMAYEYEGPGEGQLKLSKFNNLYSDRVIDEDEQQTAQIGNKKYGRVGSTNDQVAGRVQDIKIMKGYYDGEDLKVLSSEDLNENPELARRAQTIARLEISPEKVDDGGKLNENFSELRSMGESGVYYEFRPLGQRGVSQNLDAEFVGYRANEYFGGGQQRQQPPEQRQPEGQQQNQQGQQNEGNVISGTREQIMDAAKQKGFNTVKEFRKALEDNGYNVKITD